MRDLVFISMENWDDIWRRNQFLCAGLTQRFPDLRILFVGLPRDVSHALRSGELRGLGNNGPLHPADYPNITLCRPLKLLPTSLSIGRRFNDWLTRRTVHSWMKRIGMRNPVLWLNPHYAVHMVGKMGESRVIYDITDDWIELTQTPAMKRLTIAQDAELCRRADHVIVCSQLLYDHKRKMARSLHLIPNGVDADHYRQVLAGTGPLPAAAAGWAKPVLGYTGTIHPDRVDVALVERIARGLAKNGQGTGGGGGGGGGGSIVLLGPNMLGAADRARLAACGNVVFHPPVPYREIPSYMRAFDICITPHRVTPFTQSLNPIKLWEYLAAGRPIISTPVAGFTDFPQHVYLAGDAEAFLRAVPAALSESPAKAAARQAEIETHSWQARVAAISALLAPDSVLERARQEVAV